MRTLLGIDYRLSRNAEKESEILFMILFDGTAWGSDEMEPDVLVCRQLLSERSGATVHNGPNCLECFMGRRNWSVYSRSPQRHFIRIPDAMVCKRRREVASNDNLCFLLFVLHYVPEIFDLLAPCAS